MKPMRNARNGQRGVMLLEALVGILIFSIGILAVVGMQAMAVKTVAESRYRMDASLLTNDVIGNMWVNKSNLAAYAYTGGAYPAALTEWGARVEHALPGEAMHPPTIDIGAGNMVRVTIFWPHPEEANSASPPDTHSYRAITYIH